MSTGFIDLDVDGLPRGGTSLDHTIYFHRPTRADDWLFMELEPVSAAGARGVYRGSIHDRTGRLAATLVQENLMRPAPPQRVPM
jgi:acyl-CoA thioesterase-2